MPELPDLTAYVEALQERIVGATLQAVRLRSPFVLRTVQPDYRDMQGRAVKSVSRLAKRVVVEFSDALFLAIHLMRLGRFRWADPGQKAKHAAGKTLLATMEFTTGTLHLVEIGPKKRASMHVLSGAEALRPFDPPGVELDDVDAQTFAGVLRTRNHTLKRALTDPTLVRGIGNAYSDEILWEARLSPVSLTQRLDDEDYERLYVAARTTLATWTQRLRETFAGGFPDKVTAFRPEMAAHGKFGKPCPRCGDPIQRIVYSDRETNYCATCQTGGRRLADRALSRLLGKDWPRSMEELEEVRSS